MMTVTITGWGYPWSGTNQVSKDIFIATVSRLAGEMGLRMADQNPAETWGPEDTWTFIFELEKQ